MDKLRDYLRISEAAEYLEVSPNTLRNWENAGKLVAHRHPVNRYFARRLDDDRLAVIFNAGAEATEVTLDVYNLLPDGIMTDVRGGRPGRVSKEKLRGFVVPPRSAAVFSVR